jgi:hypothetical protein
MSHIPFTLDRNRSAWRLSLLDANDASLTGPIAKQRAARTVEGGLLHGWNKDAVAAMGQAAAAPAPWEQARWNERDAYFMEQVGGCSTPEDVDAVMPAKWMAHNPENVVDEKLARVCELCTALVNRHVAWGNEGPASSAQWQQQQALAAQLDEVMRLLEASIGESITPAALTDARFVSDCWRSLNEDEQAAVQAMLASPASAL